MRTVPVRGGLFFHVHVNRRTSERETGGAMFQKGRQSARRSVFGPGPLKPGGKLRFLLPGFDVGVGESDFTVRQLCVSCFRSAVAPDTTPRSARGQTGDEAGVRISFSPVTVLQP